MTVPPWLQDFLPLLLLAVGAFIPRGLAGDAGLSPAAWLSLLPCAAGALVLGLGGELLFALAAAAAFDGLVAAGDARRGL